MTHADNDLDAFYQYCQEAFEVHDADDPILQPYIHAVQVVGEYREYLARRWVHPGPALVQAYADTNGIPPKSTP